ncbi:MAG: hypothetical protein M1830_002402 [Pleopsidium flavum]|nr:MAG: hypothetical protein M1830_003585 [Pleopsidium flavum]KAI9871832.1 MAG: hypothetical protein M1830_002402 [Pleopsidium flavum]
MDPLSIAASTIAIVGAAATLFKRREKLKQLRGATEEVCASINEVCVFRVVLQEFSGYVDVDQERLDLPLGSLTELLQRGRGTLLRLDAIVHYRLLKIPKGPGEIRISHRNWLRNNTTITKFQQEVRDIKLNLALISGSVTFVCKLKIEKPVLRRSFSRINLQLEEVSSVLSGFHQQSVTQQSLIGHISELVSKRRSDPLLKDNVSLVSLHPLHRILPTALGADYRQGTLWVAVEREDNVESSLPNGGGPVQPGAAATATDEAS